MPRSLLHKVVGQRALLCFRVDSDSFRASMTALLADTNRVVERVQRLPTATTLLGAARLAALLGCSVRGAGPMLEEFVACGGAVEVTGRTSHRLFGLPGTYGIHGQTAGARRYVSRMCASARRFIGITPTGGPVWLQASECRSTPWSTG